MGLCSEPKQKYAAAGKKKKKTLKNVTPAACTTLGEIGTDEYDGLAIICCLALHITYIYYISHPLSTIYLFISLNVFKKYLSCLIEGRISLHLRAELFNK
jgi:hypothetical protein